jgi:hypothetical protein
MKELNWGLANVAVKLVAVELLLNLMLAKIPIQEIDALAL